MVAGPIVLLLALERGAGFAAQASVGAIAAIAASEAFNLAYAWSCRRVGWPLALVAGLVGWLGAALLLVLLPARLPGSLVWAVAAACVAVAVSQRGLPRVGGRVPPARVGRADLVLRMLAGVLLTLAVTSVSASLGAAWSGVLSVFPLLGIVLAVSAQRAHGADFVALLARGMVIGRGSFAAFFAALAILLPQAGVALSFACAALLSIVVQGATRGLVVAMRARAGEPADGQAHESAHQSAPQSAHQPAHDSAHALAAQAPE